MNGTGMKRAAGLVKRLVAASTAAASLMFAGATANAQSVPKYVVSSHSTIARSNGGPVINMAVNSRGDFFANEGCLGENCGSNPNITYEYPADGSPAVALFTVPTGYSYGPSGIAVDSHDNLYVTIFYGPGGPNDVNSQIVELPYTNGGYPQPYVYSDSSYPNSCYAAAPAMGTTPAHGPNTGVCTVGQYVSAAYYYWQPIGFAVDGQGNSYMFSNYDNTNGSARNGIFYCDALCNQQAIGASAASLVTKLPNAILSIAADSADDVFWVDGKAVNEIIDTTTQVGAGTSKVTIVDSSYNNPTGITFDRAGNMYVNDSTGVYETPSVGGKLQYASKFLVLPLVPGSAASVAVDPRGNIYYSPFGAGNSGPGDIEKGQLFSGTFVASPVGTASTPVTFTIAFDSAVTLGTITALQGGVAATEFAVSPGTCTAGTSFAVNSTCTFTATFTPSGVGPRTASVVITDSTGASTVTYLSGSGTGTGVSVDPGTPTLIGSGLQTPSGLAVDAAGDVFVADSTANAVYEFPVGGGDAINIGTGLNVPTGVAVDPAGNVFILNQGPAQTEPTPPALPNEVGSIVEVPNVNGTLQNSKQTTYISGGLYSPTDIVIDGEGNLFVSNTAINQVIQFPSVSRYGSLGTSVSYGQQLVSPTGLALDTSGRLYVASTGTNQVFEIGEGFQAVIGAGLSSPTGVAVDSSGSVIIADQGTGRLLRVPNEKGIGLNADHQVLLDSPLLYPFSLRLDGAGNLYGSDNNAADAEIYQLQRTSGLINFGNYNLNTSSGPNTIVLSSTGAGPLGTGDLTLGQQLYAPVPAASGFTVSPGTATTACQGTKLTAGSNCTLSAIYMPTVLGPVNYPLALAAPATNTSTPTVELVGTGVNLDAATVTIAVQSPTGPISYNVPLTIAVSVSPTGDTPTPTGLVVFAFDGQNQRPIALVNGVATITFNGVNAGAHSVQAHYEGDVNYASVETELLPITINQATVVDVLTITGDSDNPLSAAPTNTVNFLATLTPSIPGLFGGTVTFEVNGQPIGGSVPVNVSGPDSKTGVYTASLQLKTLPLAYYNVTAVYSGSTNYAGATSSSVELVISNPTFTLTPDTSAATSTAANPGVVHILVESYSAFQGGVDFQCAGLPANAYCVFRPGLASLIRANNPLTTDVPPVPVTLQFKVDQNPVDVEGSQSSSFGWVGAILAAGLLLYSRRKRSLRDLTMTGLLVLLSFGGIAALGGCAGSSSSTKYVTPPGTYAIVVTAIATPQPATGTGVASADLTTTFQVNLTVK